MHEHSQKHFFLWSRCAKNELSLMQQPLSILQDVVYDCSEASICLSSLSFHPVYPLRSRPLICLMPNAIHLIAQHWEASGITLMQ